MNARLIRFALATIAAGLVLTGCENLSPGANAVLANLAGSTFAAAAGESKTHAKEMGAGFAHAAYIIATHKATERQRRIAEERALVAYRNLSPELRAQANKTRYISVDTERDKNSKGANSVMLYDTMSHVIGDTVYDIAETPKQGTISKIENYSSVYVGNGELAAHASPSEH